MEIYKQMPNFPQTPKVVGLVLHLSYEEVMKPCLTPISVLISLYIGFIDIIKSLLGKQLHSIEVRVSSEYKFIKICVVSSFLVQFHRHTLGGTAYMGWNDTKSEKKKKKLLFNIAAPKSDYRFHTLPTILSSYLLRVLQWEV